MSRIVLVSLFVFAAQASAQTTTVVDVEDRSLTPESFENGANLSGGFISRGAFFNNNYNSTFDSWLGWSYSNVTDVATPGFGNQYAAFHFPGGGGDASSNFGIAFNFAVGDARIALPASTSPLSVRITNTTYAALSMRDGDGFAKKFGGSSTNDPDFFLLTIQGRDINNAITGTVPFYLADYRFGNNALDYIVSQWTTVDLSSLPASTTALSFEMTSSDNGPFGMNTPSYFSLDNLALAVPEPGSLAMLGIFGAGCSGWYVYRCRFSRKRGGNPNCVA